MLLSGEWLSTGIAVGVVFCKGDNSCKKERVFSSVEAEIERYELSVQKAIMHLNQQAETADKVSLEFIQLYMSLLEDDDFSQIVSDDITDNRHIAEIAVQNAADHYCRLLRSIGSENFSARTDDIQTAANNVIVILQGDLCPLTEPPCEPFVLAAKSLCLTDIISYKNSNLVGVISNNNAYNSHVAIYLRSLGIPYLTTRDELSLIDKKWAYLDSVQDVAVVENDANDFPSISQPNFSVKRPILQGISLSASVFSQDEIWDGFAQKGRNIGLFRSEFACVFGQKLLSEEEQFRAYKRLAEKMDGNRITIRTFDFCLDKMPLSLLDTPIGRDAKKHRGIELGLLHQDLLMTQLRAIYRASAFGKIEILLPFVSDERQIEKCRVLCRQIASDLTKQGIPYAENIPLGAMAETQGSITEADRICKAADFILIGTNDLYDCVYGVDRNSDQTTHQVNLARKEFIEVIEGLTTAAHHHGKRVGMCCDQKSLTEMVEKFGTPQVDEVVLPIAQLKE